MFKVFFILLASTHIFSDDFRKKDYFLDIGAGYYKIDYDYLVSSIGFSNSLRLGKNINNHLSLFYFNFLGLTGIATMLYPLPTSPSPYLLFGFGYSDGNGLNSLVGTGYQLSNKSYIDFSLHYTRRGEIIEFTFHRLFY